MASVTTTSIFLTIIILCSDLMIPITNSQEEFIFSRKLSKKQMGLNKTEKLSQLHFYLHDIASGRQPTAVRVAQSAGTNTSATGFGFVEVIDDPLTLGPDMSSKAVGRAQGMYASADLATIGLVMVFNFVFTEGEFNGSTLSVLGRNAVLSAVREMPVVGGSGVFRFARGYVEARTYQFNVQTRDAVVEYNAYVFHY